MVKSCENPEARSVSRNERENHSDSITCCTPESKVIQWEKLEDGSVSGDGSSDHSLRPVLPDDQTYS